MVFSSLLFLFIFLAFVLGIYFLLPRKIRNGFLLLVSLFFYAWGEPSLVSVMLVSIFLNWLAGLLLDRFKSKKDVRRAKSVLVLVCTVDLLILFFFKYTSFLFDNVALIFPFELPDFFSKIVLPIGISFYTFQMMSYVIDVWRGDARVQKNIISFGCYVSLFPQLIAGPIVQYKDVAEQLENRRETVTGFASGTLLFMAGLSKKVLLANPMGFLSETVYALDFATMPALTAFLGALAFSFQIYFDFSGYSDMARGLGRMLGFEFIENFNYPYISKSVTDFWRRWHISLSTWFRDYLYISLGGNRHGFLKQIRNLALVWLCTGIWHGASWNFILWGVWFGTLIILEKLFLLKLLDKCPRFVGHAWALFCAYFGWVIFSHTDLSRLFSYIGILFGKTGVFADSTTLWLFANYALLLVICAISSTPLVKKLWEKITSGKIGAPLRVAALIISFVLCVAYITASTYNPFIYFRF